MKNDLSKIWSLFTPVERRKALFVLFLIICMAGLETIGVISIMPFLSVLARPQMVEENPWLNSVYRGLNSENPHDFVVMLGVFSIAMVIFSSIFKTVIYHVINRFIHMERYSISKRLLSRYLRQPYEFFLNKNGADLSKNVLSEVDMVIFNLVHPVGQLIAQLVVIMAMTVLVVFYDPWIALGALVMIGGLYAAIYGLVRRRLAKAGGDVVAADRERYQVISESFGGIREIKVADVSHAYEQRFSTAARTYARQMAVSETLSQTPLYLVEAVGYTGLIFIALLLLARSNEIGHVLPALGMYGFAAYRMLPAVQIIYRCVARIQFSHAVLENIHRDLHLPEPVPSPRDMPAIFPRKSISLRSVTYAYPSTPQKPVFSDFSVNIRVNTTVGIVGASGSGKSTLMDLLLGLQIPQQGRLMIDGVAIDQENMVSWQKSVGYVPQHIYLADATVEENIAFGVEKKDIDIHAVERAARAAQIHDMIVNDLDKGYQTRLGERGIRLSGGQRQRIGIARALYRDPPVIFMDEATSALDNKTEESFNEAIRSLTGRKTIVVIAHREASLRYCQDLIHMSA